MGTSRGQTDHYHGLRNDECVFGRNRYTFTRRLSTTPTTTYNLVARTQKKKKQNYMLHGNVFTFWLNFVQQQHSARNKNTGKITTIIILVSVGQIPKNEEEKSAPKTEKSGDNENDNKLPSKEANCMNVIAKRLSHFFNAHVGTEERVSLSAVPNRRSHTFILKQQ